MAPQPGESWSRLDALLRRVRVLEPDAERERRQTGGVEDVGVRAAAAGHAARLAARPARPPPRPMRQQRAVRLVAVAAEGLADVDLDVDARRPPPRPGDGLHHVLGLRRDLGRSWLRASPATAQRSGDHVERRAAAQDADVGGGLLVEPAETHRGDGPRGGHHGAPPALGRDAGVGRDARGTRPTMRFCVGDATMSVPGAPVAVEHEHAPRRERAEVERLGAEQAGLLPGGEHELHVAGRRLGDELAGQQRAGRRRRLVVRAQDRGAVAAHEAVGDDHLRRARRPAPCRGGRRGRRRRLAAARDARDRGCRSRSR